MTGLLLLLGILAAMPLSYWLLDLVAGWLLEWHDEPR